MLVCCCVSCWIWPPDGTVWFDAAGVALGEACTIVLRGASSHILEEADRSLHDALCVLSETVSGIGVVDRLAARFGEQWQQSDYEASGWVAARRPLRPERNGEGAHVTN